MHAGINLEFARSAALGLEEALAQAAEAGYRYVEPYVYSRVCVPINSHLGLESVSSYHHVSSDEADAGRLNRVQSSHSGEMRREMQVGECGGGLVRASGGKWSRDGRRFLRETARTITRFSRKGRLPCEILICSV